MLYYEKDVYQGVSAVLNVTQKAQEKLTAYLQKEQAEESMIRLFIRGMG